MVNGPNDACQGRGCQAMTICASDVTKTPEGPICPPKISLRFYLRSKNINNVLFAIAKQLLFMPK
jgi:hypothetical protein